MPRISPASQVWIGLTTKKGTKNQADIALLRDESHCFGVGLGKTRLRSDWQSLRSSSTIAKVTRRDHFAMLFRMKLQMASCSPKGQQLDPKAATEIDLYWMDHCLRLAKKAAARGEVPVACVIVGSDGLPLAKASNRREALHSPVAHCEILALHAAGVRAKNWRLTGSTLYCNLEPCIMCAAALVHSRIERVVFGASDLKFGGVESLYHLGNDSRLNHRFIHIGGVRSEESKLLLRQFFQERRRKL